MPLCCQATILVCPPKETAVISIMLKLAFDINLCPQFNDDAFEMKWAF